MPATAFASEAAIIAALRYAVGQGTSTTLLPDAAALVALNAARREVNRRRPKFSFGYFATVADQATYSGSGAGTPPVSGTGAALDPVTIYWQGDGSDWADVLVDDVRSIWSSHSAQLTEFYKNPLADIDMQAIRKLLASDTTYMPAEQIQAAINHYDYLVTRFAGRAAEDGGTITLTPTPSTTGVRVYWCARIPRFTTPEAVTEDFSEALMAFATAEAAKNLLVVRGGVLRVNTGTGKGIETDGGKGLADLMMAERRRFETLLPRPVGRGAGAVGSISIA